MNETPLTYAKIKALLAFLPGFSQSDRVYIQEWQGTQPIYEKDVIDFFTLAAESCWMDFHYQPEAAGHMVHDDDFIAQADLPAIKTMLTFCVRGERFSDGFWASMLAHGRVQAILRRLDKVHLLITPLSQTLHLILADVQPGVVQAWQQLLADKPYVTFHQGSIFDVTCDALVSPANSFGFMDGGIDMAISRFFGWHVQERVQTLIRETYHGELLVGQADIVPTDHASIPYVITAPTMRVPMVLTETVNVYLATRAALLLIRHGRFPDNTPIRQTIRRVAVPGMGTGVGKVPPAICARQMRQAILEVMEEQTQFPQTWAEAQQRHQLLYGDTHRDLQH